MTPTKLPWLLGSFCDGGAECLLCGRDFLTTLRALADSLTLDLDDFEPVAS